MNDTHPGGPAAPNPSGTTASPPLVRPACWSIGRRNPRSLLQCNTYLRSFGAGEAATHVCIDPGSRLDCAAIENNLDSLIGGVEQLHAMSLNHQDPDVIGNVPALMARNPRARVMVTEDVWRIAQHMLPRPREVHFVNASHTPTVLIGSRHGWQLVPTPFCHFRGAMAFYDPELRILFSGDLFGGLNRLGRVQLEAEETDWPGIAQFHQIYMPGRNALRYAIRQIRALDPPVEVIAPQHGFVICGDLVPLFMERLHDLPVGHDLLALELDETYLEGYRDVLLQVVQRAAETMGHEEVLRRLKEPLAGGTSPEGSERPLAETEHPAADDGLDRLLRIRGDDLYLEREGYAAIVKVLARLCRGQPAGVVNALRSEVLGVCQERGLPIPPIGAGLEEGGDES